MWWACLGTGGHESTGLDRKTTRDCMGDKGYVQLELKCMGQGGRRPEKVNIWNWNVKVHNDKFYRMSVSDKDT